MKGFTMHHTDVRIHHILKDWIMHAKVPTNTVGYMRNSNNVTVFTPHPGQMIGRAGVHIDKYKALLQKECFVNEVEIIEVTDFVTLEWTDILITIREGQANSTKETDYLKTIQELVDLINIAGIPENLSAAIKKLKDVGINYEEERREEM